MPIGIIQVAAIVCLAARARSTLRSPARVSRSVSAIIMASLTVAGISAHAVTSSATAL
jgi:hypothetical protein